MIPHLVLASHFLPGASAFSEWVWPYPEALPMGVIIKSCGRGLWVKPSTGVRSSFDEGLRREKLSCCNTVTKKRKSSVLARDSPAHARGPGKEQNQCQKPFLLSHSPLRDCPLTYAIRNEVLRFAALSAGIKKPLRPEFLWFWKLSWV